MRNIQKNKLYGYFEVFPKPSIDQLKDYYANKYYQEEQATYAKEYSESELEYFNIKIEQKDFVIEELLVKSVETKKILDIGCGEGFTLDYFFKRDWSIRGLDFSDFGLRQNHPHLSPFVQQGDLFDLMDNLRKGDESFDVVWLDNVLEHVLDPVELIKLCKTLTKKNGILVIEVPNDYSDLQLDLLKRGYVEKKYWEAIPDHLSYFSHKSLKKLMELNGWKCHKIIGDFPIEWFLTNNSSNYSKNKDVGRQAHESRIYLENFLHRNHKGNIQAIVDYFESLSSLGQGRQLTGFFQNVL